MTIAVFLAALLGAMAIGVPVAFSLMFTGIVLMFYMGIFNAQIVAQNMISGADTFTLLAIPFFLLAGELMNAGGLSKRIIEVRGLLRRPSAAGSASSPIIAAVIMASLSGSAAADTAALASILIPMMRDAGYNVPRAAGLMASGGIIAPVIPPSIAFIIFGVAANVSITQLFMAGIVPGPDDGDALVATWMFVSAARTSRPCRASPGASGRRRRARRLGADHAGDHPRRHPLRRVHPDRGRRGRGRLRHVRRHVHLPRAEVADLYGVFLQAAKTTSVVLFLVAAALVSAWLITSANIPAEIGGVIRR
jgi:TRAP-type transport system large permease protein